MPIPPDTATPFAPIVVGAVYRRKRYEEVTEEATCVAAVDDHGIRRGIFKRFGYADEIFTEGGEQLASWELVYNPREIQAALKVLQAVPKGKAEPKKRTTRASRRV